jgi:hypothetical protein
MTGHDGTSLRRQISSGRSPQQNIDIHDRELAEAHDLVH